MPLPIILPPFALPVPFAAAGAVIFPAFYVIYTVCGVSDVVDGVIARATGTTSEFGARLDSIADLSFYTVIIVRLLPSLWIRLPGWFWYLLGAAVLVRLASYVAAAVKFHRFASVHTYLNKLTGPGGVLHCLSGADACAAVGLRGRRCRLPCWRLWRSWCCT